MEDLICPTCQKKFRTQEALDHHTQAKHSDQKPSKKIPLQTIGIGVSIIVLLLLYVFVLQPRFMPTYVIQHERNTVEGAANATVTIVEFSDFQCPFCGKFSAQTLPQIRETYIATGRATLVYKHLPLVQIHEFAQKSAEAAECAGDQGGFFAYHDKLFANQQSLAIPSLKQYASQLGLNQTQFNACLDSGVMNSRVQDDVSEATSRGLGSTPTFFINGELISGAQPYSVFASAIERALAK